MNAPVLYPYKGQILTLQELSEHPDCVVSKAILANRLSHGTPITRAMTLPKQKSGKNRGPFNQRCY